MAKGDTPQLPQAPSIFQPKPLPTVPQGNDYQVYQPLLHLLMNTKYSDPQILNEAQELEKSIGNNLTGMLAYSNNQNRGALGPVPAPLGFLSRPLTRTLLSGVNKNKDNK